MKYTRENRTLDVKSLENISLQVKRDILRMVHQCQSGHPGGSLGSSDFLVTLFFEIMEHHTDFNMEGKNEDVFFLSNGHISPVFYSVLARAGYFDVKELSTFRQLNSRLQGHPSTDKGLPGVRVASGSLGQGISVAIGLAQAKKLNKDNHFVYTLTGDGELQEGQIWEAVMYAGAKKLDNLIVTVDFNGQQIDGACEDVLDLGNLKGKFEAFDWEVFEIKKGNNISDILETLLLVKENAGRQKPIVVLLHSIMGHGVDFMAGTHQWHGIAPSDKQLEEALAQIPETLGDF